MSWILKNNIFKNVFDILLNVTTKTKNEINARLDLKIMLVRLELKQVKESSTNLPSKIIFCQEKKNLIILCMFLKGVKFIEGTLFKYLNIGIYGGSQFKRFKIS